MEIGTTSCERCLKRPIVGAWDEPLTASFERMRQPVISPMMSEMETFGAAERKKSLTSLHMGGEETLPWAPQPEHKGKYLHLRDVENSVISHSYRLSIN